MTIQDERELDLMVADLRSENDKLKAALGKAEEEAGQLRAALERIFAVSRMAFWDSESARTAEVDEEESRAG